MPPRGTRTGRPPQAAPTEYENVSRRIIYPSSWSPGQQRQLDQMFEQADATGYWFFSDNLAGKFWFTAAELQAEHENGKFLWSAGNWTLRDPREALQEALDGSNAAARNVEVVRKKIVQDRIKETTDRLMANSKAGQR